LFGAVLGVAIFAVLRILGRLIFSFETWDVEHLAILIVGGTLITVGLAAYAVVRQWRSKPSD